MNIDTNSTAPHTLARGTTQEAAAALQAIQPEAKAENAKQIAAMSDGVDDAHIAEHVRGMVAATMAHLSSDAFTTTRDNAEQWQLWALGVADGVQRGLPALA